MTADLFNIEDLAEYFANDPKLSKEEFFPLNYKLIDKEQCVNKMLLKYLQNDTYTTSTFHRGGRKSNICLITTTDGKIIVPESLQKQTLEWYHTFLLHPGQERTEETIRQHFYWPRLREDVRSYIKCCDTCQHLKRTSSA